ncbi:MAG: hypothetical protein U9Q74_07495 [Gemmatimonadota bacterium]|nr:hypothetical protein [Gemmatimonadota bacterium]
MLLALTDHLRCTGDHAETWLVAQADAVEDRRMVEGTLGCPVCRAERAVRGGVVWWSGPPAHIPADARPDLAGDALVRSGALLAFADSRQPYVLCGAAGLAANGLAAFADAPLVLLDPPDDRAAPFTTIVRAAPSVPFAARSVRGALLDEAWASDAARLASAVAALVAGGRLVAPAGVAVPAGVRELARDSAQWVGERVADVVGITRGARGVRP